MNARLARARHPVIPRSDPTRRTWGLHEREPVRAYWWRIVIACAIGLLALLAYSFPRAAWMAQCTPPPPGYALHWHARPGPDGTPIARCEYQPMPGA